MKKLYEILEGLNFQLLQGNISDEISKISYDTRKLTENSVFVAIEGSTFDGHDFIETAIACGANVVIVSKEIDYIDKYPHITFINTQNTRKALAILANNYYNNPAEKLKIIGITGTNGKTTTTFIIKSILEQFSEKCAIIGTTGIYYGEDKIPSTHTTPESLELFEILALLESKGAKWVIMEVSSHSLTQFRVHGINFTVAIFTNLTQDHLDYHNTMAEYALAKKILFDNLSKESIAVIFNNSDYSKLMVKHCKSSKIVLVGRENENNAIIKDENCDLHFTEFNISYKNKEYSIHSKLIGLFNIENLANSFICLLELGFVGSKIIEYIQQSEGAPGRMSTINLKNGAIGIVDYSHTPDALEKALSTCRDILNESANNGKLICVFGCGGNRDKTKRPIMGRISSELADFSIITNDNPRNENPVEIANDIYKGIEEEYLANVIIELDRAEAIAKAFSISNESDLILVAGKGHEDYQIIGNQKSYFDDKEELKKYI